MLQFHFAMLAILLRAPFVILRVRFCDDKRNVLCQDLEKKVRGQEEKQTVKKPKLSYI